MLKLPVLSLTPLAAEVAEVAVAAAAVEDVVLEMVCSHLGQALGAVLEVV